MKNTRILSITAGLVVVGSIIYTFSGDSNVIPYVERIQKERADKDTYLLTSKESPLSEEDKRNFQGLSYYPVNELFKVKARLELIPAREIVTMPTSDGKEKPYRKFAVASFELNGEMQRLVVFQPIQKPDNLLFLPFADGTSALETYGAGRYLDFEMPDGTELTIDFNMAYNPYCAYSEKYSCPLPPKENFMSITIEAGEKNYLKN